MQDYLQRNKHSSLTFEKIKAGYDARIQKEWLMNLLNLAFFKRGLGYGSMNLERKLQGKLLAHAMERIR